MSSDNRRARLIQPRPIAEEENPTAPNPESSSTSGPSRLQNNPSTRTNIRSACLACRRRRSRCSGGNPCSRCRALETECLYNESQDGRTRGLRERSKEELDLHKKVLNGLFRAIQEGREGPLLDLIRNHASLEQIAALIDETNSEPQSESAPETPESQPTLTKEYLGGGLTTQLRSYQSDLLGSLHRVSTQTATHSFTTDMFHTSESSSIDIGVIQTQMDNPVNFNNATERYMLHPAHLHDDSNLQYLSNSYISFRDSARRMIHTYNMSYENILGGPRVSCKPLFGGGDARLNVSTWASAIVNDVPGVDILFRLAWLCYLTRFMRWAVVPTLENFSLVPQAMIPSMLQVTTAHAPVIDLVPIPRMRDLMIENFRNFSTAIETAGATLHWTESIDDAIDYDPMTGHITVSARFEDHISTTDNFCFGRSLLDTFPELEGQVQIAEASQIISVSAVASPLPAGYHLDAMS